MPQQRPHSLNTASDPAGLRSAIRREQRALRAGLDPALVHQAARRIARQAWRLAPVWRARHLAIYWAVGGEVSCDPVVAQAWRQGHQLFLPVLSGATLRFAPFGPDSRLAPNRFGIPEPECSPGRLLPARAMDVILAPLVAFDGSGTRLGMGGGFYDRTLAFRARRHHFRRPHFIGLAYDFQRVALLPRSPWDVPVDAVVTDRMVYNFARSL